MAPRTGPKIQAFWERFWEPLGTLLASFLGSILGSFLKPKTLILLSKTQVFKIFGPHEKEREQKRITFFSLFFLVAKSIDFTK